MTATHRKDNYKLPKNFELAAIVAMSKNRVIGNNNQLPWHLPADLKHFKTITTGGVVIMGRKTFASIGRKLPNRTNIIITRNPRFQAEGCIIVHSLKEAILHNADDIIPARFIIGGSEIYKQSLSYLNKIYLTIVEENFIGDAFFPDLNPEEWKEVNRESHLPDENNAYAYTFVELNRINPS